MPGFFFVNEVEKMFVDKVKIKVKGGDGGNGCSSFRREKFIPKGGPDGGDGGNGGNVILETSVNEQSLVDLSFVRHYEAGRGDNGKGKDLIGRTGQDVIIKIPVGTVVTNVETGEFIADLNEPGMRFTVAHGGSGGWGNRHFATSTNRAPRRCNPGTPGEELQVELELKIIADVGLVGYPNAGKSTLLGVISNAHPKVAPYPFTTLNPVVGVVEFPDYTRLTVADIPGLIDGASENVGLGHEFLRHIERTVLLVYVLDMSGIDGRKPWDDFTSLKNELNIYQKGLSRRGLIIAANKMDAPGSKENLAQFKKEFPTLRLPIIEMAAGLGENIEEFMTLLKKKVQNAKKK